MEIYGGEQIEGFAEIPGKNGKIWYSYIVIVPLGQNGRIIETRTTFYEVIGGVEQIPKEAFQDKNRYLGPLKNIERVKEQTGDFIFADDPYLENESLSGKILNETDEWVELGMLFGVRAGPIRFLKE